MTFEHRIKEYLEDVHTFIRIEAESAESARRFEEVQLAFEPLNAGRSFKCNVVRARFLRYRYPDPGFAVMSAGEVRPSGVILEISVFVNPRVDLPGVKTMAAELLRELRSLDPLRDGEAPCTWAPGALVAAGR